MSPRVWALVVLVGACGRVGFEEGTDARAGDGGGSDALPVTCPSGMVEVPVVAAPFDFSPATPMWKQVKLTRSFCLDRDEVTVKRWASWIAADLPVPCDGCALDPSGHYAQMRWHAEWNAAARSNTFDTQCSSPWAINGSTYPTGQADFPMNCMSWMQAIAFCAWDGGKRLPTAVEWNYEARAGGDHRSFVWGDAAPDCAHATFDSSITPFCSFPIAVGSAPAGASVHGARDLNGSVWEWGWDATNQATLAPTSDEVLAGSVDFAGFEVGATETNHVLFGGEWGEDTTNMNLTAGNNHGPGVSWPALSSISTVGVRCAQTLL